MKIARREKEFDFIRAICALWIIGFWHLPDYINNPEYVKVLSAPVFYQFTYCVLATFTLISGYFAFYSQFCRIDDVKTYYKKRLIRIYPLYAFAGILFGALSINANKTIPFVLLGISEFIEPYPLTIWFIGMLIVFYLLTPVMGILKKKNVYLIIIGAVIVETIFICLKNIGMDERTAFYWPFYCTGLCINELQKKIKNKSGYSISEYAHKILYGGVTHGSVMHDAILLLFPIWLLLCINNSEIFNFITLISGIIFFGWIYILSIVMANYDSPIIWRAINFLSYSSMCAYLFHRPILDVIIKIIGRQNVFVSYIALLPIVFVVSNITQSIYDFLLSHFMY